MNLLDMNTSILKISSAAIFLILVSSYVATNSNAYAIWGHGVSHGPNLGNGYVYQFSDAFTIDKQPFDISKFNQVIPTQSLYVNVPSTITLKIYHTDGAQSIKHVALYFNQGSYSSIISSKTSITYDADTGLKITDYDKIFEKVTADVSYQGHFMYVTFKITPQKTMDISNMIVQAWDYRLTTVQSTVMNAIQIIKWQSSLS